MVQENFDINVRVKGARQAQAQTQGLTRSLGGVATAAKAFVGALAVREVLNFTRSIINASKQFETYYNQLRLVTNGNEQLNQTFVQLQQGARDARVSFGEYVDLFTKLRVTTQQLGYSIDEVETVTNKFSKALAIAGADGATAASVIRQFGQAMASGEVRGDEFRSIVEGMGSTLALMAAETGYTVGELRKMSREGKLTADVFFEMFQNSKVVEILFASLTPTTQQLETAMVDAFTQARVELGKTFKITESYRSLIKSLTRTFQDLAGTEGALVNVSNELLYSLVESGSETYTYSQILDELNHRYSERTDSIVGHLDLQDEETLKLKELIRVTEEKVAVDEAEAKALNDRLKAEQALAEEIAAAMKPYQTYVKLSEEYMNMDFGSELDKVKKKYEETRKTIEQLNSAQTDVTRGGERYGDLYDELQEKIDAATVAQNNYLEEIKKLEAMENPFYNFTQSIEEQGDVLKQLDSVAQRTYGRMADAITDFVMTGKFSFKDLARSIIADLVRIAAQAAITFAIKTAAAAVGIPLPFLAEGGPAKKGNPYIVGEQGPELFVPNQSGTVVSNDDLVSMSAQSDGSISSAPVNISFNINTVDATSFDELLLTRRGLIASMINEGLARQGRRAIV